MSDGIRWQHFEPTTLQKAAAADRPVLMVLTAPWCHYCRELMAKSFTDPQVVALVEEAFVFAGGVAVDVVVHDMVPLGVL